jgi:hypothetical protein
VGML